MVSLEKKNKPSLLSKDPANWKFWLLIAFLFRLLLFIVELHINKFHANFSGFWGGAEKDSYSYIDPIDSLIHNGSYSPDHRMPGYGILYLPLAILFPKAVACNILIIIQLLVSTLSCYLLALTALHLFKKDVFFYATFLLYTFGIYSFSADIFLMSESLTTSFLIISVFYFVTYFNTYSKQRLFISGLFFTWVIFLRPVFGLLYAPFLIVLIADSTKARRSFVLPSLLFISSFLFCDGLWIIRNYQSHKEIIPLMQTIDYPDNEETYIEQAYQFTGAIGGNTQYWIPRSEIFWFTHENGFLVDVHDSIFTLDKDTILNGKLILKSRGIPFQKNIYTSKFNEDSLVKLRRLILQYNKTPVTVTDKKVQEQTIKDKFQLYAQSIIQEKPLFYQIGSRWRLLKEFLTEASYEFPYIRYTYKPYHIFCMILFAFGIIGILLIFYFFRFSNHFIIAFIPFYTIAVHVFVFRASEGRYFVPAFPFVLICAVYAACRLKQTFFPNPLKKSIPKY